MCPEGRGSLGSSLVLLGVPWFSALPPCVLHHGEIFGRAFVLFRLAGISCTVVPPLKPGVALVPKSGSIGSVKGFPRGKLPSRCQLFIVVFTDETVADLTRASKLDSFVIMAEN